MTPRWSSCLALCVALGCQHGAGAGGGGAEVRAPEAGPGQSARSDSAAAAAGMLWLLATEAALEEDAERERRAADEQAALEQGDAASEEQDEEQVQPLPELPDVIYVATPEPVVDKMLELAQLKPADVVYDLGCGDGRIVIRAAQKYGVRAWGFDIDPVRVAEARANAEQAGVAHLVSIEQRDIFTLDLSAASVVTLYLTADLNQRLIPQLNQMAAGSRVVSHDFEMPDVPPLEHAVVEAGSTTHDVFFWTTPLPVRPEPGGPAPERVESEPD